MDELKSKLAELIGGFLDPMEGVEAIKAALHELSPNKSQPVDRVRWVPIDMVQANDYNPNSVAKNEMRLLHTSISHDGYTQPVVTIWDEAIGKFVIVDGFHRYTTMRLNDDIQAMCHGMLPIVVIEKDINDRMASTVRHNRARGKHSITGMASMVFSMLENGWSDEAICAELGLEGDELLRLKHVTGFSKLFEDVEYRKSWETNDQIKLRIATERAKNASRRTIMGSASKAGMTTEGDAEDQYTGARGVGSGPTQAELDARQVQLDTRFADLAAKADASLVGLDCPHCGGVFYVEKRKKAD
jgi:hypothetical protein